MLLFYVGCLFKTYMHVCSVKVLKIKLMKLQCIGIGRMVLDKSSLVKRKAGDQLKGSWTICVVFIVSYFLISYTLPMKNNKKEVY